MIYNDKGQIDMNSLDMNSIIISQICKQMEPGKKKLQKLMYLISRKGVGLDLNYSIHYFGPYSSKLDSALHTLEHYDKISIDTGGSTHIIKGGNVSIEGDLSQEDQQKVDVVLEKFSQKSAYELEAITTVDYVANTMLKEQGTDEEIINKVEQIKGTKFPKEVLYEALAELQKQEYITTTHTMAVASHMG